MKALGSLYIVSIGRERGGRQIGPRFIIYNEYRQRESGGRQIGPRFIIFNEYTQRER